MQYIQHRRGIRKIMPFRCEEIADKHDEHGQHDRANRVVGECKKSTSEKGTINDEDWTACTDRDETPLSATMDMLKKQLNGTHLYTNLLTSEAPIDRCHVEALIDHRCVPADALEELYFPIVELTKQPYEDCAELTTCMAGMTCCSESGQDILCNMYRGESRESFTYCDAFIYTKKLMREGEPKYDIAYAAFRAKYTLIDEDKIIAAGRDQEFVMQVINYSIAKKLLENKLIDEKQVPSLPSPQKKCDGSN